MFEASSPEAVIAEADPHIAELNWKTPDKSLKRDSLPVSVFIIDGFGIEIEQKGGWTIDP